MTLPAHLPIRCLDTACDERGLCRRFLDLAAPTLETTVMATLYPHHRAAPDRQPCPNRVLPHSLEARP